MLSILKKKTKLTDIFNKIPSKWDFQNTIIVKDFSFKINTNNEDLSFYIENSLKDFFLCKRIPNYNYEFNFLNYKQHTKLNNNENSTINFIRFFDTFFYYKLNKGLNKIDVLLPKKFENWEVENFFKIFISGISLKHNCLLIHASAVIVENEIVLFSGQSTAGKSTIANLSELPMIHDDNILISYLGNEIFEIETIPFKTPYKKQSFKGKIRGFYRLFKDSKTYVKEVDKNKQLTHLLFGLWAFDHFGNEKSKQYNKKVMEYCMEILPLLNVKELYFTKTKDFLKLI